MRLPHLLMAMAGMFSESAKGYNYANKYTRTNPNPHNFTRFEVAPNFFIRAVNIESATAQYNKIMAHKAMRLEKSNEKVCAS